jgi:hypothetical protein
MAHNEHTDEMSLGCWREWKASGGSMFRSQGGHWSICRSGCDSAVVLLVRGGEEESQRPTIDRNLAETVLISRIKDAVPSSSPPPLLPHPHYLDPRTENLIREETRALFVLGRIKEPLSNLLTSVPRILGFVIGLNTGLMNRGMSANDGKAGEKT